MPTSPAARPTLAQVRRWPPTVSPARAGTALGISRSSMYDAIRSGRCPVSVTEVNGRKHVLTASLVQVLEGRPAAR